MSDRASDGTRARRVANVLIVVAIALLVVGFWYSFWPQKDTNTDGSSAPPLPRLTDTEHRSANEALQALKAVQSITIAGVNYQEYSRRVLDAKVSVDRSLVAISDPTTKAGIEGVMEVYVFVSLAWNAKIRDDSEFAVYPWIRLCPAVEAGLGPDLDHKKHYSQDELNS